MIVTSQIVTLSQSAMAAAQAFEARRGSSPLGAFLLWSSWAAESLDYLDDLDQAQGAYPNSVGRHHPDMVDIAHVRWAAGTAITSIDLCAAALGRACCGWNGNREIDLRNFDPTINPNRSRVLRGQLPGPALNWVDAVLADGRYSMIQGARNPLTHSWMSRQLSRGAGGGHAERTHFRVANAGTAIGARDLVVKSRELAQHHFAAFLNIVPNL